MIDPNWLSATKKQDPEFAGSIHEELGFDNALCPTCGAHLRNGICLNACHLIPKSQRRFSNIMKEATRKIAETHHA